MFLNVPEVSSRDGMSVITEWFALPGERVVKGQDIVELSSDKATFDLQSPCDGVLVDVVRKRGENVSAGETIAEIREI